MQVGDHIIYAGQYSPAQGETFVIKYDKNCNIDWIKQFFGSYETGAVTANDGYLLGGAFYKSTVRSTGQFGDYWLTNNGEYDAIILLLEPKEKTDVIYRDIKTIGGNGSDKIEKIIKTADEGYFVCGNFESSSMTVGDFTLTNKGSNDVFLIKYDKFENVEWATSFGDNSNDHVCSISLAEDGGCVLGGYFKSYNIDLGGSIYLRNWRFYDTENPFLIKFDSSGEVEWAKSIESDEHCEFSAVASTNDGGYLVGGYFSGTSIQVGGNVFGEGGYTLNNKGGNDALLVKYDSRGEVEWAKSFGRNSSEHINSVIVTEDGDYLVAGRFFGDSDLQIGDYTFSGEDTQSFIVRYNENGDVKWATSIGAKNDDSWLKGIQGIIPTKDGGYTVLGTFYGSNVKIGDLTIEGYTNDIYNSLLIKFNKNNEV